MAPAAPSVPAVEPTAIKQRLDAGEKLVLLDVREPDEVAICRLEGSTHIPMNDLPARAGELDRSAPTVVYCHHGVRSQMAASWLRREGFADVANLAGGIDRWAVQVDPGMERY